MGWLESVPYFCAATETVADQANNRSKAENLPPHPLEKLALTKPDDDKLEPESKGLVALLNLRPLTMPILSMETTMVHPAERPDVTHPTPTVPQRSNSKLTGTAHGPTGPPVLRPFQKPVRFNDVYLDDLLFGTQGNWDERVRHLRRLLYSIDDVFRPLDEQDSSYCKHVPSQKKFRKGDGYPVTCKVILGWIVNSLKQTLELPPHRKQRLADIFEYLRGQSRVGLSKWQKILGELRSMAIGIPGSRGFFSLLQNEIKFSDQGRIRLMTAMVDQLSDFEYLANSLNTCPTSLAELVPDHPVAIGPHDASRTGMGGVWLPAITNSNLQPLL